MSGQETEKPQVTHKDIHDLNGGSDTNSDTFAGHHWPRLKAVITRALKSTDNISACAVSTGISNAALISVCIEEKKKKVTQKTKRAIRRIRKKRMT